ILNTYPYFLRPGRRHKSEMGSLRKIESAAVMGATIPVMHGTGMAAHFMPASAALDLFHALSISKFGTAAILISTIIVLGLAALSFLVGRRYPARSRGLESGGQRYRLLFERSLAGMIRTTLDGKILDCNHAC